MKRSSKGYFIKIEHQWDVWEIPRNFVGWSHVQINWFNNTSAFATCYVCVCVCVCVCVYTLHLLAFSGYKTFVTYLRCKDQRSCVVSIAGCFYQVPSSPFRNLSYFTPKDETPTHRQTREKRYDVNLVRLKMIYIDIGYKSVPLKADEWWKDTKDKRLL